MTAILTLHDPLNFVLDKATHEATGFFWRAERWRIIGRPEAVDVCFYPELTHDAVVPSRLRFQAQTVDDSDSGLFEAERTTGGWLLSSVSFQ